MQTVQSEVYQKIEEAKLLPLYTATNLDYLDRLEEILLTSQLPIVEVTFRSELAETAIKKLAKSGKLMVGAGTVRTLTQAKAAIKNGAKFIVSPAVIPEVIEYSLAQGIPVFPGTATPSEIQQAVDYGIHIVKFFPADIYGGLKAIKALSGPFYDVKFLPTGGIDEINVLDYLNHPQVIAVGGSFILSETSLKQDDGVTASQHLNELIETIKGKSFMISG
ncbi:bifunctional 4-hydroxy-2-oxoglutarate aldolase/2-dehydro-3-deoxy-phosphogluconate aldolase [Candidatus Enterococcus courvalinii]|uniref:Bifunctional 4-hydroxy-2-oxoglutarate aldolase/2-dehydro-3-deoxy-phosphogluconate aldolase n=1 Tax=Candidatus Enterococcus courvalinii TaxID=2815329 RepID=A0ABS3HZT3_9ENTE|nr:bifunctional 4-hydroxy-2-oxoglutarate aldolase/2-dehydro-3-deoxy-phosphogluconate aldolase [Enterococcus sp. MSG2901]MBO0481348.1 bifunctional 4-hydroxy-2-oxoglutarate aldolase/2-dehydro-3-deoxy-phosphogluconate aldolase [Enterococcus sp. MSG2901]